VTFSVQQLSCFMGSFARGGIPHDKVMRGDKVIPRFA
jgi:hypothetical protein